MPPETWLQTGLSNPGADMSLGASSNRGAQSATDPPRWLWDAAPWEHAHRTPDRHDDDRTLVMTSPSYDRDPRVDQYIDALPDWQQAICHQVREIVHTADPEVQETIKRRVQPYFVLQGNICALLATRITSTFSFTTARSSRILKASSPAATTTR